MRPFQGQGGDSLRFPGALPPATLSCPYGAQRRPLLATSRTLCRSRIPEGDSYSSRGQRPRKAGAEHGLTLKGSNGGQGTRDWRKNAGANMTNAIPRRRPMRPLQGRAGVGSRVPGALPPATVCRPCGAEAACDPYRVGRVLGCVFRGRCPRLLYGAPAGRTS